MNQLREPNHGYRGMGWYPEDWYFRSSDWPAWLVGGAIFLALVLLGYLAAWTRGWIVAGFVGGAEENSKLPTDALGSGSIGKPRRRHNEDLGTLHICRASGSLSYCRREQSPARARPIFRASRDHPLTP
jgi:hypothetical protein